jgi:DNA-binding transcriptional LysR family regulator
MKANLNLRQIETFRAVMISGSIVGAAQLMNVTQPGVSRTIGMLEDRLGYALFLRRGRRIVPTPEGEALYREVEKSYRSIEAIAQIALNIGVQRAGALRVATLPALAQWLVPRAISRFLSTRPDVTIFVQSLPSVQIAELVSTRQFDLGIVEMPVSRPAIDIEELGASTAVAVLPAAHRLAALDCISIRDLAGERMIMLSQHSFARYHIDDAFSSAGVAPVVVIETPSSTIACALVTAGVGITIVSQSTVGSFISPGIAVRPLAPSMSFRYSIVFPQLTTRSMLANAFAVDLGMEFREAESSLSGDR